MLRRALFAPALVVLAVTGGDAGAAERSDSLDARVGRLERLLDNQTMVEMGMRMEQLQQELQQLRGELELQSHRLKQMEQRQRDLYLDLDRRMRSLEGGAAPAGGEAPSGDAVGGVIPGAPAPPPPTSGADADLYRKNLDLLKDGRYDEADRGFRAFLGQYPDGPYAPNAQYWLGEANYVQRRFDIAETEFQKLLQRYPQSRKAPDAMLKLGYIYYEYSKWNEARDMLTAIVERYGESTAARLAQERLDRMKREGR